MTEKQETSAHLDAQLGVIGSLLLDADKCAGEVFLRTREDQYTGEYKILFAAAKRLYQEGRPIDPVTVRGIAGEEYTNLILQIMELTPTAANCGAYLDLLVEQAQVSKMQTLGLALASCKGAEEAKHLRGPRFGWSLPNRGTWSSFSGRTKKCPISPGDSPNWTKQFCPHWETW